MLLSRVSTVDRNAQTADAGDLCSGGSMPRISAGRVRGEPVAQVGVAEAEPLVPEGDLGALARDLELLHFVLVLIDEVVAVPVERVDGMQEIRPQDHGGACTRG